MVCSICGRTFTGWGNNAQPVNDGRCCDDCNMEWVIPVRIAEIKYHVVVETISKTNSVKKPCQGCVYFEVCGNTNRTQPCDGRMTKSQRKETK